MYLLRAGGKEARNCKLVVVTLLNSPGIISQPIIICSKQKLDHISVISKTPFFISQNIALKKTYGWKARYKESKF
jgi:hypothetical protein